MNAIEDYLVGYACKGEKSAMEGPGMLREMIENSDLPDATPFARMAKTLNSKLLASREVPFAEVAHLAARQPSYISSETFSHVSLNFGRRILKVGGQNGRNGDATGAGMTGDNDESMAVENHFVKFCKRKPDLADVTFYQFCVDGKENRSAVFRTGKNTATWPLNEVHAQHALTLHKAGVFKFEDIKGAFPTYVAAFDHYLRTSKSVPPGLNREIQRAFADYIVKGDDDEPNVRSIEFVERIRQERRRERLADLSEPSAEQDAGDDAFDDVNGSDGHADDDMLEIITGTSQSDSGAEEFVVERTDNLWVYLISYMPFCK